eukprot:tig00000769_g4028.t1
MEPPPRASGDTEAVAAAQLLQLPDELLEGVIERVAHASPSMAGLRVVCALRAACRRTRALIDGAGGPLSFCSRVTYDSDDYFLLRLLNEEAEWFVRLRHLEMMGGSGTVARVLAALPRPALLEVLDLRLQPDPGPPAAAAERVLDEPRPRARRGAGPRPRGGACPRLAALRLERCFVPSWAGVFGEAGAAREWSLELEDCWSGRNALFGAGGLQVAFGAGSDGSVLRALDLAPLAAEPAAAAGLASLTLRHRLPLAASRLAPLAALPGLRALTLRLSGLAAPDAASPRPLLPSLRALDVQALREGPRASEADLWAAALVAANAPGLERLALLQPLTSAAVATRLADALRAAPRLSALTLDCGSSLAASPVLAALPRTLRSLALLRAPSPLVWGLHPPAGCSLAWRERAAWGGLTLEEREAAAAALRARGVPVRLESLP